MRRWNDAAASGMRSPSASLADRQRSEVDHRVAFDDARTGINLLATNIQTANPQASIAFGSLGR
jgi:hypothetical protein